MKTLYPQQREHVDALKRCLEENGAALDASETGCFAEGTKILMADGSIKNVQDVGIGDFVMGWDSTPRKVEQLIRGNGEMVKITPTKGSPFVVNKDHTLTLQFTRGLRPAIKHLAESYLDISVRDFMGLPPSKKHLLKLFRVPIRQWPQEPPPLLVEPYFLGVLLGDGSLGAKSSIIVSKPDEEIQDCCAHLASTYGGWVTKYFRTPTNPSYRLVSCEGLIGDLRTLGLLGKKSGDKFIPKQYLWSEWSSRAEILAGLLDTDGSKSSANGFDYISKSEQLANDVAFLSRSLGLAAYLSECSKSCQGGHQGKYWRVSISGDTTIIPLRIPRKQPAPRVQKKNVLRTGFTLEPIPGEHKFFGFTISGDGRFCLGDFTVTHNCGKTTCATTIARELGVPAFIVCPKAVIPAWEKELLEQGVQGTVINYEKLRQGGSLGKWKNSQFIFNFPPETLMIWDEVHKAKSKKSLNAKMLIASKPFKTLMLSATAAEDPTEMRAMGFLLGLFRLPEYWAWCEQNGCSPDPFTGALKFNGERKHLEKLHAEIFPSRGHRMTKEDLKDHFKENEVDYFLIQFKENDRIIQILAEMEAEIAALAEARQSDSKRNTELTTQLRARQEVELLKVPDFVEMIEGSVEKGMSVAMFVNFSATIESLQSRLTMPCGIVQGGQSTKVRQASIDAFQEDRLRVILCNIAAGGVGVSLHDTNGNFPRVALISPTYNAKDLHQVLGRIHRAGGKTPCVQRILVVADTIEERVAAIAKRKLLSQQIINTGETTI